jgi:hypothetical protein
MTTNMIKHLTPKDGAGGCPQCCWEYSVLTEGLNFCCTAGSSDALEFKEGNMNSHQVGECSYREISKVASSRAYGSIAGSLNNTMDYTP